MIDHLSRSRSDELIASPLTYPEVGATEGGAMPAGYRIVRQARQIRGVDLAEASRLLLGWEVHRRAGLRLAASHERATIGAVVEMQLGIGPLSISAPCRVVDHVDEADRAGFAYGTLPGHPESGEERFFLDRDGDGILFAITAFSRPSAWFARVGAPVATRVQDAITARYLRALETS